MNIDDTYFQFHDNIFCKRKYLSEGFLGTLSLTTFSGCTTLKFNDSAFEILESLDGGYSVNAVIEGISSKHKIARREAEKRIKRIVGALEKYGLGQTVHQVPDGNGVVIPPPIYWSSNYPLSAVSIELLDKCNLKCQHCYGAFGGKGRNFLDVQKVIEILNQLHQLQCQAVSFTGGEVLLHPNFLEILRYANEKHFELSFLTNGTLISGDVINELKKIGPMEIQVSLDGPDALIHDQIRGVPGAFESSLSAIRELRIAGFIVAIGFVVMNKNVRFIREMVSLSRNLKVPLKLGPMLNYGRALLNGNLGVSPGDYFKAYKIFVEESKRYVKLDTVNTSKENKKRHSHYVQRCAAGQGRIAIKCDGNILPCEILPNNPYFIMGNINDEKADIYKIMKKYNRDERLGSMNAFELEECKECPYIRDCKGGCIAASYSEFNSISRKDPFSCARTHALMGTKTYRQTCKI